MIFVVPACLAAWCVLWSLWAVQNGLGSGELALCHPVCSKGSPRVAMGSMLRVHPPQLVRKDPCEAVSRIKFTVLSTCSDFSFPPLSKWG